MGIPSMTSTTMDEFRLYNFITPYFEIPGTSIRVVVHVSAKDLQASEFQCWK